MINLGPMLRFRLVQCLLPPGAQIKAYQAGLTINVFFEVTEDEGLDGLNLSYGSPTTSSTESPTPPPATLTPVTPPPSPTLALPTATPISALPTSTSEIPIPDGLLPPTLTPAFFENLYQQALTKASVDIPGANFAGIEVEIHPFGSVVEPLIIWLRFTKDEDAVVRSYKWSDKTNDLAYKGETHTVMLFGASNICTTPPWQRKSSREELIRYGYLNVHESFPVDANSRYTLLAEAWKIDCRWRADFWYSNKILDSFVLNESGPSHE